MPLSSMHGSPVRVHRYMTNASGLVVSEVTVCKLGDDDYYVVGGRDNLPIDLRIMQVHLHGARCDGVTVCLCLCRCMCCVCVRTCDYA